MLRRSATSDLEHVADQIVEGVAERIVESIQSMRGKSSLSFSQIVVLTMLVDGPLRLGQVAGNLGITSGSATPLVDGLERRGLVERRSDPSDRRAVLVGLSAKGFALMEQSRTDWRAFVSDLLKRLSPEAVSELLNALGPTHQPRK